MDTILSSFSLYVLQVLDIFYKLSFIIALFYATKALRVYIDKNTKKNNQ